MVRRFSLVALGSALVGCGGGSPSATEPDGAAQVGGDSGDASHPADAPTEDTSTDGGLGESATNLPYTGEVLVERYDQGPQQAYLIAASFEESANAHLIQDCASTAVRNGSCCYYPPAAQDAGSSPGVSAGTVTVTSGTAQLATLAFGSEGYPLAHALDPPASTLMWNPGDTLGVSAAGDTVDAFSASVVTPDAPAGLSPALGATGTQITMSASQGWTISWTPGVPSGARVLALLSWSGAEIKCVVDDASGSLSIPSALLGNITGGGAELTLGRAVIEEAPSANATVEVVPVSFLYWSVQITP